MADTDIKESKKDLKKRMVKALFSYTPVNCDELTLKINDVLEVIEETEEGWWKGILDGNVGMFPSNFVVELDSFPDELNDKFASDLSPLKNVIKTKNINQQQENKTGNIFLIQNKQEPKSIAVTSGTDAMDGSNSSKSSADMLPEKKLVATTKKPPVDSTAPRLPPKPVREQARVVFRYEAQNEDELNLKEGDIITVLSKEIEDKGWWRGELNNKIGVFPDNFVKLIKAEEQKKPERPDKPPAVIASKINLKHVAPEKSVSESSPKLDKKNSKTPPAKPPPPEIHKKEPDKPLPPCPLKKPPPPLQPVKKPSRSSLGPKLPASPTAESSKSIPKNKTEENTELEVPAEKEYKLRKEETEFDLIESSSKKLVHLTAYRAKAPNRRPPSFIFLKENERESKTINSVDCRRLSEPLLTEFNAILPLDGSQKKSAISASNVEIKPKITPARPPPAIAKSSSLSKPDSTLSKDNKKDNCNEDGSKSLDSSKKEAITEEVLVSTKETLRPRVSELTSQIDSKSSFFKITSNVGSSISDLPSQIIPKVPTTKILSGVSIKTSSNTASISTEATSHHVVTKPPAEIASSGTTSLENQVLDIKEDLKVVINNMVTKNEYNALLKQVDELKAILETYNENCNKAINDLKEELNEEKRLRSTIEMELQKLKECLNK